MIPRRPGDRLGQAPKEWVLPPPAQFQSDDDDNDDKNDDGSDHAVHDLSMSQANATTTTTRTTMNVESLDSTPTNIHVSVPGAVSRDNTTTTQPTSSLAWPPPRPTPGIQLPPVPPFPPTPPLPPPNNRIPAPNRYHGADHHPSLKRSRCVPEVIGGTPLALSATTATVVSTTITADSNNNSSTASVSSGYTLSNQTVGSGQTHSTLGSASLMSLGSGGSNSITTSRGDGAFGGMVPGSVSTNPPRVAAAAIGSTVVSRHGASVPFTHHPPGTVGLPQLLPQPPKTNDGGISPHVTTPTSTTTAASATTAAATTPVTVVVPKTELHALYGRPPRRKILSGKYYHTWHDSGQAHQLQWSSIFVCPLTGELFLSGRYAGATMDYLAGGNNNNNHAPSSLWWFTKKVHAEHAAAARAYDCLVHRDAVAAGLLSTSLLCRPLGLDPPYEHADAVWTPPHAGIPFQTRQDVLIQQGDIRRLNGLGGIGSLR